MAIQVFCNCGNSLSVGAQLAGKKVRCKACSEVLQIPDVPLDESAEDEPTSGPDDYEVVRSGAESISCSVCGATASPEDTACLACGADLSKAGGPGFLSAVPRQYLLGGLAVIAVIVMGVLAKVAWTSSRPGSYTKAGHSALDAEDFVTAETSFKQALEYDPAFPGALIGLAQTGVAAKKNALINRYGKQVLRQDLVEDETARAKIRVALGWLLLEENSPKDASEQATSALKDDESLTGEANAIVGLAAADLDLAEEAIAALNKSVEARYKNKRVFMTLARLHKEREEFSEARAAAERAVDLDKESSDLWLTVAELRGLAGDQDAVPPALLQAIRFDEKNAIAYSRLSEVYLSQGKTDEAVKAAEKAHEFAAEDAEVLVALGRALLANDQPADALKPLKKAHALTKNDKQAWEPAFLLGRAQIQISKVNEGMRLINDALRSRPKDAALHLEAATFILEVAKKPGRAATILQALLKSGERSYEARVLVAKALARKELGRRKHDQDIQRHLEEAIKIDATRREAPLALGMHLFETLRPVDAIEAFDRGLTNNERDKDLLYFKGWACIRARRWDDAINALNECLRVAPSFQGAKEKLEEAQEGKFYERD